MKADLMDSIFRILRVNSYFFLSDYFTKKVFWLLYIANGMSARYGRNNRKEIKKR